MGKISVGSLAKTLGIEPRDAISRLKEIGVDARTATSQVDEGVVARLINSSANDEMPVRVASNIIRRRAKVVSLGDESNDSNNTSFQKNSEEEKKIASNVMQKRTSKTPSEYSKQLENKFEADVKELDELIKRIGSAEITTNTNESIIPINHTNGSYLSDKCTFAIINSIFLASNLTTSLVKNIQYLITKINNNYYNKHGKNMFEVTNNDFKLYSYLEGLCTREDDLIKFSSSLWQTLFERTQEDSCRDGKNVTEKLKRLPRNFKYSNNEFIRHIDSFRHHFGGHNTQLETFKTRSNQPNKQDVLLFFAGSSSEPQSSSDYIRIQLVALFKFNDFLMELDDEVK